MRIATWNLEQRNGQGTKGLAQARRIANEPADVWCLTEAGLASLPPSFKTAPSAPMPGVKGGACFAIVAAADLEPIEVDEVPTAAAAVVHIGAADWLVVAICMPWRFNAPCLPVSAAPGMKSGPEQWGYVLERLERAIVRIRRNRPKMPLVLAGDFNQTMALTGRIVGSRDGRTDFRQMLANCQLSVFTADAPSIKEDCTSVDHICGPAAASEVTVFPRPDEIAVDGQPSDHLGYSCEVVNVVANVDAKVSQHGR